MRLAPRVRCAIAALAFVLAGAGAARAVNPDEMLKDPALEQRARVVSEGLRCLVCQNQSIDDSNAPLAHDLRVLLRERLAAGDSNQAAVDYIVARYGNFVLLKPPMQVGTLVLWFGPLAAALFALVGMARYLRANAAAPAPAASGLTSEEEARADALFQENDR